MVATRRARLSDTLRDACPPRRITPLQELDAKAPRRFAVLKPLKVTLEGLPKEGKKFEMANHPKDEAQGKREMVRPALVHLALASSRRPRPPKRATHHRRIVALQWHRIRANGGTDGR